MARLKNRSSVTRKLDSVRKSLNASQSASYGIPEGKECDIEAKRIESTEGRHYVLIRGKNIATASDNNDNDFLRMDFRSEEVRNRLAIERHHEESEQESSTTQGEVE